MNISETTAKITAALVKAQSEFPPIAKTRTARIPTKSGGSYSYKYADLTDILEACVPVLVHNGIAISQEALSVDGRIGVATILYHTSGEWIAYDHLLMSGGGDAQAAGSAITYARRYALTAALGIAADDDDDGAGSNGGTSPSGERERDWGQPSNAGTGGNPREGAASGACTHPNTSPLLPSGRAVKDGHAYCIDCRKQVKEES